MWGRDLSGNACTICFDSVPSSFSMGFVSANFVSVSAYICRMFWFDRNLFSPDTG